MNKFYTLWLIVTTLIAISSCDDDHTKSPSPDDDQTATSDQPYVAPYINLKSHNQVILVEMTLKQYEILAESNFPPGTRVTISPIEYQPGHLGPEPDTNQYMTEVSPDGLIKDTILINHWLVGLQFSAKASEQTDPVNEQITSLFNTDPSGQFNWASGYVHEEDISLDKMYKSIKLLQDKLDKESADSLGSHTTSLQDK